VSTRVASLLGIVRQRVGNTGRNILYERSPEGDIEKLRSPTDCKYGLSHLARRMHKRYFSLIAKAVYRTELLVRSVAIKRRVNVLASTQYEAVDSSDYAAGRCR